MSSDNESDGGETTLGSPPESLSPCFWAGSGAKISPAAAGPVAEADAGPAGRPRGKEEAGYWKLTQLSDVCSSMEMAMTSPPIANPARSNSIARMAGAAAGAAPTTSRPTARKALLLSPASQLDVLSQISELAERNLRDSAPVAIPVPSTIGSTSRPHVWATAQHRRKKRAVPTAADDDVAEDDARGSLVALPGGNAKKRRTHGPQHSDKLEADMLDWETCSEDLFLGHDDALDDAWEFEDVSDSDFE